MILEKLQKVRKRRREKKFKVNRPILEFFLQLLFKIIGMVLIQFR